MSRQLDRSIGWALFASVVLQGIATLYASPLAGKIQMQVGLIALALAALARQLWRTRRYWSPHLDMLLLMGGFGGLAMALAGLPSAGLPACHRSSALALLTFMPMWHAGVVPALLWSRCLRQARQHHKLVAYLTVDGVGMAAGMYAAHFATAVRPLPFHHASMCAGMLLGMALAMQLRPALSPPQLWNSSRDLMFFTRHLLLLALCLLPLSAQTLNTLTPAEKQAGWESLFDGKTYNHWRDPSTNTPAGDSWTIEDGSLKAKSHPRITEDLVSKATYRDFELAWDWKIAVGGNSGLKYRIQDFVVLTRANHNPNTKKFEDLVDYVMDRKLSDRAKIGPEDKAQIYVIGFEYQMIDDEHHPDAKRGNKHITGALYDIVTPSSHPAHPAGEWNSSRLIVKGDHIEHWLNGVKVVDSSLKDPAVAEHSASRWGKTSPVLKDLVEQPKRDCPISLQNHGDDAWFRNIRIRKL